MNKTAKVYKALMVEGKTHKKIAVKAKQEGVTIDKIINNLLKKICQKS